MSLLIHYFSTDCHAEIVSRRCLLSFLYSQLENLSQNEESIFEPREKHGGYKLKSGIRFHLYINTAPCGDARIFSPHEAENENNTSTNNGNKKDAGVVDPHPNRKARGQLRTKIESGEFKVWMLTKSAGSPICGWSFNHWVA